MLPGGYLQLSRHLQTAELIDEADDERREKSRERPRKRQKLRDKREQAKVKKRRAKDADKKRTPPALMTTQISLKR